MTHSRNSVPLIRNALARLDTNADVKADARRAKLMRAFQRRMEEKEREREEEEKRQEEERRKVAMEEERRREEEG